MSEGVLDGISDEKELGLADGVVVGIGVCIVGEGAMILDF